eukprot:Gb_09189 [translate_table: standard]
MALTSGLFLHPVTESELIVDTSRGETLQINFDVTFPALACSILSLDAMDISGEQHLDVKHDIIKKRLDPSGKVIETRPDGIGAPKSDVNHNQECNGDLSNIWEAKHCDASTYGRYRRSTFSMLTYSLHERCRRQKKSLPMIAIQQGGSKLKLWNKKTEALPPEQIFADCWFCTNARLHSYAFSCNCSKMHLEYLSHVIFSRFPSLLPIVATPS